MTITGTEGILRAATDEIHDEMIAKETNEMIRVLLVDDQTNIRRGLRMRLGLEPDLTVVGEASDGEAALAMARLLAPNVVLMDIEMPIMDGITATAQMRDVAPNASVVMLSLYDDTATREKAAAAGAVAFIAKSRMDETLLDAIRAAGPRRTPSR